MNSSLVTADRSTHLKIVVIALLAATLAVWIGITARLASEPAQRQVTTALIKST